MLGSILIFEVDQEKISQFDIEDLEHYKHIELDSMCTIDFETLSGEVEWTDGEPVFIDEEAGEFLFPIHSKALEFITSDDLDNAEYNQEDIDKIKHFVDKYGASHIYEYSTV